MLYILFLLPLCYSLKFIQHPLESRISYVEGISDVRNIPHSVLEQCKIHFEQKSPMLIFKNQKDITPKEFLEFSKQFDENRDEEALITNKNQSYWQMNQMLQPFDQFPECKHVAPRGNYFLKNYYGCKKLQVEPSSYFKDKYLWHADTWAHNTKRMNKITAFYVIKQPLIGGETDFISGETIYENIPENKKEECKNIIVEVSREPFLKGYSEMDYSNSQFNDMIKFVKPSKESLSCSPVVIMPKETSFAKPSFIISPILVQRIKGSTVKRTRKWIEYVVNNYLLPHRVTIQWKEGDLAIFNNKLFIHSSTPANNYLNNKFSNERFLLQTFIPTKEDL